MRKTKSTKQALLLSMLSLLLCVSMLVGTTFAWFTDSVSTGNNVIASGNLDVELYWSTDCAAWNKVDANTNVFEKTALWEPGHTEVVYLKVANEGSLYLKYQLGVNVVSETTSTAVTGDPLKLSEHILYGVVEADAKYASREKAREAVTNATELAEAYSSDVITLAPKGQAGAEETVALVVYMPEEVGNEANHAKGANVPTINLGLNVLATQKDAESDSFGTDYDKDAVYADVYVSNSEELAAAIQGGATLIGLEDGEYFMPDGSGIDPVGVAVSSTAVDLRNKTLKLVGSRNAVLHAEHIDMRDQFVTGADLTFEGLTLKFGGAEYMGFANTTEATYRDCAIIGLQYLSNGTVNYENCEFTSVLNASGKPAYCVGTYTAKVVNFHNCTFDTAGKAILVYAESHFDSQTVNIKDCTFKASASATTSAGDVCAAVEIDASLIKDTYTINLNGENSYEPEFAGLYRIKNQKDPANVTVNENGKTLAGFTASKQEELNQIVSAGNAVKVELEAGSYTMPDGSEGLLQGKSVTITGTEDTVIDAANVDARDQFVTGAELTFEGVTLNFGTSNYMGFANTKSLTYKNCTINGLQFLFGENVTFENCTLNANGAEHCVWTYGVQKVSFTDCDFTYGDRGINCYSDNDVTGGKQTVNFTDCTFTTENTASAGAVEINSCFFSVGIEVNLTGCTAPAYGQLAYVSPWDSNNGAKTTINIQ